MFINSGMVDCSWGANLYTVESWMAEQENLCQKAYEHAAVQVKIAQKTDWLWKEISSRSNASMEQHKLSQQGSCRNTSPLASPPDAFISSRTASLVCGDHLYVCWPLVSQEAGFLPVNFVWRTNITIRSQCIALGNNPPPIQFRSAKAPARKPKLRPNVSDESALRRKLRTLLHERKHQRKCNSFANKRDKHNATGKSAVCNDIMCKWEYTLKNAEFDVYDDVMQNRCAERVVIYSNIEFLLTDGMSEVWERRKKTFFPWLKPEVRQFTGMKIRQIGVRMSEF